MAAQFCRVQHRAGGLFILICRNSEEAKALNMRSFESYVQAWQLSPGVKVGTNVKGFQKDTVTVGANLASQEAWTDNESVVDQLLRQALTLAEKVEWTISNEIGETNLESMPRKSERALDEEKALGGMRSSWKSVVGRPHAIPAGAKL